MRRAFLTGLLCSVLILSGVGQTLLAQGGPYSAQIQRALAGYGFTAPGVLKLANGTAAAPSLTFAGDPTKGLYSGGTNDIRLALQGADKFRWLSGTGAIITAAESLSWGSSGVTSVDLSVWRDGAANTLAQRNGVNAQRFNIANTYTSAINREDFSIDWQTVANEALVGMRTVATGTSRRLFLESQGSNASSTYYGVSIAGESAIPRVRIGAFASDGTSLAGTGATTELIRLGEMSNSTASGTVTDVSVMPTYNQSTATTANTDFLINRTETALGSGQQNLVDLQVGGASRYRIDNTGLAFVNTVPTLAYVAGGNFTTAANTNLQTITGLTFALPANTVLKFPFFCKLTWSQATAAVVVSFGLQTDTLTPTAFVGTGQMETNLTVTSYGNTTIANTTATAVVTGTPAATATVYNAYIEGFLENPSGAATNVNVMVKTATAADVVTVYRDSWCRAF